MAGLRGLQAGQNLTFFPFLFFLNFGKEECIFSLILLGYHNHQNSLAFTIKTPAESEQTLKCELLFFGFFFLTVSSEKKS